MRKCSKPDGNKNWVGKRIAELRKDRGMSQNDLAIKLQNYGVDIDKNAVQLLEHGHRLCTGYGVVCNRKGVWRFDGGLICGHSVRY